jgi:MarR family 2-MHQ and catechol resistance regulon transcriptional repressor
MSSETLHIPRSTGPDREVFYENLRTKYAKRYKGFDTLATQAGYNLVLTWSMGEARLSTKAQERGMTLPGINVLCIINEYGQTGCPLNTLSRLLLVSRANVTGLVDSLVRHGYVSRHDHAKDRRVVLAKITKAGEDFLESYLPTHYGEIKQLFSGLTANEKHLLIQLLTKLRRSSFQHPREKRMPS